MSYEHPQSPPPSSADQTRTLGMLAHLGGILAYFYVGWVAGAGHLAGEPREGGTRLPTRPGSR